MAFTDDFNRTNEDLEDSADWDLVDGAAGAARVFGNVVICDTGQSSGSYRCPDQASANHYAQAAIRNSGNAFPVVCRMTDGSNGFGLRHEGTHWQLYKQDTGSFTQLGSNYTAALVAGDIGRIECDGNDITVKINGTTRIGPITDSFNNTETRQGVWPRSNTISDWFDDFEAGTLTVGDTAAPATGQINIVGYSPAAASDTVFPVIGQIDVVGYASTAEIAEATIASVPSTVARGESAVTITGSYFGAVQGSGSVTFGGESCTIDSWSDTSIDVTIPSGINLLYDETPTYTFVVTADDATSDTSSAVDFTPASGRSYITLSSPAYSSNAYMLFGYEGTPAPVTGDQLEYDTNTVPSSIANEPELTSEWVLASMPTVPQTTDCQIIRAATGVRSTTWTITWAVEHTAEPSVGSADVIGYAPTAELVVDVDPVTGQIDAVGYVPQIESTVQVTPSVGIIEVTGLSLNAGIVHYIDILAGGAVDVTGYSALKVDTRRWVPINESSSTWSVY